jgi:hypothetical protein
MPISNHDALPDATLRRPLLFRPDLILNWIWVPPVIGSLYYPWALRFANHAYTEESGVTIAVTWLITAYAVPAIAFLCLYGSVGVGVPAPVARPLLAGRLSCLALATPPAFTLVGVLLYLMRIEGADIAVWTVLWLAVAAISVMAGTTSTPGREPVGPANPRLKILRTLHGITALLLLLVFLGPHLVNHLLGVFGFDTHKAVMEVLRGFYRYPLVEPVLLTVLLFQILSGLVLFTRKNPRRLDLLGALQLGSGAYLALFIPTHANSVFTLARYFGVETDYAWAVGAPAGLLADAWNIRLLPHYSLGVFLLLAHLACGLRMVLRAHGTDHGRSNTITWCLIGLGAAIAMVVTAAMLGWRLT